MFGNVHSRHRRHGGRRSSISTARLALFCLLCVGGVLPLGAQQATAARDTTAAEAAEPAAGEQTPLGQTEDAEESSGERVSLVSAWDFVRMLLVLAAVIAFIYVIFVLLRKSARRATVENELITVLGSKGLAGNRSLHLVRVGKSVYLVGSADGSVGLVSEISDKESVDELLLEAAKHRSGARRSFSEILGSLIPQGGHGQLALPDGLGFVRRQRERLRRL